MLIATLSAPAAAYLDNLRERDGFLLRQRHGARALDVGQLTQALLGALQEAELAAEALLQHGRRQASVLRVVRHVMSLRR